LTTSFVFSIVSEQVRKQEFSAEKTTMQPMFPPYLKRLPWLSQWQVKNMCAYVIPIPRDTFEYSEGRKAYRDRTAYANGNRNDPKCPYPTGNSERVGWYTGWYDERTKDRIGELLERNGMLWP